MALFTVTTNDGKEILVETTDPTPEDALRRARSSGAMTGHEVHRIAGHDDRKDLIGIPYHAITAVRLKA